MGSGIKGEGNAPAGFENKAFINDPALESQAKDPDIGIAPSKDNYVTKIQYCASATGNIDALQLDTSNGITGDPVAGTPYDPTGKIAAGDASCSTVDITKYKCFRSITVYTDAAAAAATHITSISLTDSDGAVKTLSGGSATEVAGTPVTFGAKGCLAAYDFWFSATSQIANAQAVWQTTTTIYEDTICKATEKAGVTKSHAFELPETAAVVKNLVAADSFYEITSPNRPNRIATDCVISYAQTTAIAGIQAIDATGKLDYSLAPAAKGTFTATIQATVTNTKTSVVDTASTSIEIVNTCGPSSTTISAASNPIAAYE